MISRFAGTGNNEGKYDFSVCWERRRPASRAKEQPHRCHKTELFRIPNIAYRFENHAALGETPKTVQHWTERRRSRRRRDQQQSCIGRADGSSGFTLLEVLVSLTVLAVGAALALSLISGSLGNIRKVQLKTRTVEHAEAVMELALLNDSISQPTTFTGDFEDGTRWSVRVENYTLPETERLAPNSSPQNMPVKLLRYTVEMFSPDSSASDYQLQTLKVVRTTPEDQRMRLQ